VARLIKASNEPAIVYVLNMDTKATAHMTTFGRPLGGAMAAVASSQILSTVVHTSAPQWRESFATMSNLALVLSGCYHHFHPKPRSGSLQNPAFPLLLLGVSSFAFHGEPEGSVQKHTLDIFFGWVVVLHLGCTATSAALTEAFSEVSMLRPHAYLADIGFVVLFSSSMLVVSALYSHVKSNQLLFYIICGSTAIVFAGAIRVRLSKWKVSSVILAAFESVSAVGIAASAVFLQGQLVGRSLSYSEPYSDLYDLFHGCWHIQMALVVSLLHLRYADVLQQTEQPVRSQSYIVAAGVLDVSWLLVFFVQAIVLLVLKEVGAHVVSVQVLLWTVSVLHVLHIVILAYITYRPKNAIRTSDVRPLIGLQIHDISRRHASAF